MNEKIKLLKDKDGNLWCYVEYDTNDQLHKVTVVEEDNGHYINTGITWYLTNEELSNCTKIEMEV